MTQAGFGWNWYSFAPCIALVLRPVSCFSDGDKEAKNNKHVSSTCLSNIIPSTKANHMTKPNITV